MKTRVRKHSRWIVLGGLLAAVVALRTLAASSSPAKMTPTASKEWSRGQFIGHTPIKQPAALQPAPGGGVFLVWPNLDGRLELAHVGADGQVLLDRVLPVETQKARAPQLQIDPAGYLHLLWREQAGSRAGVRYVRLEADGIPVSQPRTLSDRADRILGAPRLAQDAQNRIHALWANDDGIHWTVLDGEGSTIREPGLVFPGGHSLLLRTDDSGRMHLAWQQKTGLNTSQVYYAALDSETGSTGDPEEIVEIVLNDRMQLDDIAFGLSQGTGHVLWSEYDEGFDRYLFKYALFSLGTPSQKQTGLWHLLAGDGPMAISMPDRQLTPLPVALSERVMGMEPDAENELTHYLIRNESAVASGDELQLQISLISVGAGQARAKEQIVTASSRASMKPVLAVDAASGGGSRSHLAWLETGGFGQYRLVYASTAPGVLAEYNALTVWDVLDIVLSKLFRLSLVVVTVVLTFIMWAIIPLLGLVVFHLVTSEEMLETTRSWAVLAAVLVVEVILTFALPPRIAGIENILPVLRWGIPAVATVIVAVLTANVVRRRDDAHLFGTFLLFTTSNSLLQMALYLLF